MADVLHIRPGFSPWKPAPDAELVKDYQYYEIPRTGVIAQHGVRYFFTCLDDDPQQSVSLWLYACLSSSDEAVLDSAPAADFNAVVDFDGPAVLALAIEGVGVVAAHLAEELTPEGFTSAHRALVHQLSHWAEAAGHLEPA